MESAQSVICAAFLVVIVSISVMDNEATKTHKAIVVLLAVLSIQIFKAWEQMSTFEEIKAKLSGSKEYLDKIGNKMSVVEMRLMGQNVKENEATRQIWNALYEWCIEVDMRYPARIAVQQWLAYAGEKLRNGRQPNIWLWRY